ncbi:MAG TPA: hypothetical protein PKL31_16455 [Fulvivirga sp.]|nr:hypothetical protein [Fulvivirga sp.]
MKLSIYLILGYLMIGFHPTAFAQTNSLELLKPLEGKWSGSGWISLPDRTVVKFNQTEDIQFKLNNNIVLINGKGKDITGKTPDFEAYAIIYAEAPGVLKMSAHTMEGEHTLADLTLEPGIMTWWFKVPNGGTVKYSTTFTDTTWTEKGNYSPDGQQWFPFFEMTLKKDGKP